MTTLQAIILGIIQGITEFLPVSSSGHMLLAEHLFGLDHLEQYVLFTLVCHVGTLLAILCVLLQPIKLILKHEKKRIAQVALATLPLFPIAFLTKPIKAVFDQPHFLGFFFLLTAAILWLGHRFSKEVDSTIKRPWRDSFVIGMIQTVAILPGISRSGSTISTARMLGWSPLQAIQFSFFLAIPAIMGGFTLELSKYLFTPEHHPAAVSPLQYALGFLTSFLFGFFALRLLMRLAAKNRFMYFVWYCVLIGLFTLLFTNL